MKRLNTIPKRELYSCIVLLFFVLIPRFFRLSAYPPLIVDEPANLRDVDILRASPAFIPGAFEWDYSMGMLVQYPSYIATTFIKDPLLALRSTSVIASLFVLMAFYLIMRRYTSPLIAWCTTLMFSSSYWFLQFSRVGWTNIHALVAGLWMFWFLLSWYDHARIWKLIASAICGGILLYTHRSGEVYFLASGVLLCVALIRIHASWLKKLVLLGAYILIVIAVSFPWMTTVMNNWERFTLREKTVSVFSVNRPYHGLLNTMDIIRYQIQTSVFSWLLFIPYDGGNIENPRYFPTELPQISYFVIPLCLAGMILSCISFKRMYIFLFMYILAIVFGQIFTVDPPNGSRALVILPVIYIFVGVSLEKIRHTFHKISVTPYILIWYACLTAVFDIYMYSQWMRTIKV
jgi:hypothetical protein